MVELVVAPCSHEAAKYACEKYHYTGRIPQGKNNYFGVWEDRIFIGAVVYGFSISPQIGTAYGLTQHEVTELKRVALFNHMSFVSQALAQTFRQIRQKNPGLRLIVSFADTMQEHHGGIYQATNWIYVGLSTPMTQVKIGGRWRNDTHANAEKKHLATETREIPGKHKYLYPLDKAMRRQIEPLAKPYPKRADVGEIESRDDTIV